jgi:hypothetical protein
VLERVLIYHERVEVLDVKLIDVPQAAVALHQRAVLLISRPALRVVATSELQALVAHEISHDYFWREFEDMFARGDRNGLQELELRCDDSRRYLNLLRFSIRLPLVEARGGGGS